MLNLTCRNQCLQVRGAADWVLQPRLTHCTLHLATLFSLTGAQGIVTSGAVGATQALLRNGVLGKDCAILKPGH